MNLSSSELLSSGALAFFGVVTKINIPQTFNCFICFCLEQIGLILCDERCYAYFIDFYMVFY